MSRLNPPKTVVVASALAGMSTIAALISAPALGAVASHSVIARNATPTAGIQRLCSRPTKPGIMACFALRRVDSMNQHVRPGFLPAGYGPLDLQSAYKLDSSAGGGQTVAIVDAYNDPTAESDLAAYRTMFGLPACTTANGCFKKVNESGVEGSYPANDPGWSGEISLDLDMVSATCPKCHILLVEATTSSIANLGTSVNTAVSLGAKFVSNSYGGGESSGELSWDTAYYHHNGVAITASTGDNGYGISYPAASPYVAAVGGTSLVANGSPRGWGESAWSGAGSGCSLYEPKPSYQNSVNTGCTHRADADVSAVADPNTGVAVYQTYGGSGWTVYGGTSVSSPIIASVYALAGTPGAGDNPVSYPYLHPGNLFDITSGANGSCSVTQLCHAGPGWDGPTGLGTPNGSTAFKRGPHWVGPLSLGMGPMASAPAADIAADGQQYVYWKGADGNLDQAHWNGSSWSGPVNLGMGPLGSQPTAGVDAAGRQYVFWQGTDLSLEEATYNGSSWTGPVNLGMGSLASPPGAAVGADGQQYVYWKGSDNALWEAHWNLHRWIGPSRIGMGPLGSQPTAGVDSANRHYVFWKGTDNTLKEGYYNGSGWVGPVSLGMGPLASPPGVAVAANGRRYVFWKGTDNSLKEGFYNGVKWFGPLSLGMAPLGSQPTAVVDSSYAQYVFWQGTDNALKEAYWSAG